MLTITMMVTMIMMTMMMLMTMLMMIIIAYQFQLPELYVAPRGLQNQKQAKESVPFGW